MTTPAGLLAALALPGLTSRPMFGEHGVFLDGRMVALVCDGRLWVKLTPGTRAALPGAPEAIPFKGGRKPYLGADPARDGLDAIRTALHSAKAELPPTKRKAPR